MFREQAGCASSPWCGVSGLIEQQQPCKLHCWSLQTMSFSEMFRSVVTRKSSSHLFLCETRACWCQRTLTSPLYCNGLLVGLGMGGLQGPFVLGKNNSFRSAQLFFDFLLDLRKDNICFQFNFPPRCTRCRSLQIQQETDFMFLFLFFWMAWDFIYCPIRVCWLDCCCWSLNLLHL